MNFFASVITWFSFVVALLTYSLGFFAVARAPKSALVRAFGAFSLAYAVLSFIEWGYRQAQSVEAAQFWVDAGAVWPFGIATLWSLGWVVVHDFSARRRPILQHLMYAPALIFSVLGLALPSIQRTAIPEWWGYSYALPQHPLMLAMLGWATATSLAVAFMVIRAWRTESFSRRRVHRAFLGGILALVAVTALEALLGAAVTASIPSLSTVGTALLVVPVGLAVTRHGMWEFAPETAAETILETMGDAVLLVDENRVLRYGNRAAEAIFGRDALHDVERVDELIPSRLLSDNALGRARDEEVVLPDGSHTSISARVERMPSGIGGYVVVLVDRRERLQYEKHVSYLVFHDALTGLGNRQAFFGELATLCNQTHRDTRGGNRGWAACLLIDIDRFKDINDAFGHAAGDDILTATAEAITSLIRSSDRAFRLGGDEFAVLLRQMRSRENAAAVVNKILGLFAEPVRARGVDVPVRRSIGYTIVETDDTAESVFARVDAGVYEAKHRRVPAVEFTGDMDIPQTKRALVHARITAVARRGGIDVHYQPIVRHDGSIVGLESLARWPASDEPTLTPDEFIPAAEQTGAITEIGSVVRARALEIMRSLSRTDFFVSVNISPVELQNGRLLHVLLDEFPADFFRRMHLELTESELMDFGQTQRTLFDELIGAGSHFLIDDFGTGHSSITRLRDLPVSGVKLDKSFLDDIESDSRARTVVEGAIRLARGLGLDIVAEGVESKDQVDLLYNAGCELFQGYYFHRPMPADEAVKLLQ